MKRFAILATLLFCPLLAIPLESKEIVVKKDTDTPIPAAEYEDIPLIPRIGLNIYINPTTLKGRLIKQHLTREWVNYILPKLRNKTFKDRIHLLQVCGQAEFRRRDLMRHFDIKLKETSDRAYFYVGYGGRKIYFPDFDVSPLEFPGVITFFTWVKDIHFFEHYRHSIFIMNKNIRSDWRYRRKVERRVFAVKMEKLGYEYHNYGYYDPCLEGDDNYDYWPEGFLKKKKDAQLYTHFSFEDLGFKSKIVPPLYLDPPAKYSCPFKEDWDLPK